MRKKDLKDDLNLQVNNDKEPKDNKEQEINEEVKKASVPDKDKNGHPSILPHVYVGGPGFFKKNLGKLILALKIIALILIVEILFLTYYLGTNIKIFDGVSINGIDLGGLSKTEAEELLRENLTKDVVNKEVIFYFDDYKKTFNIGDIIDDLDYAKIARTAQRVGREGNLFKRFMTVVKATGEPHEVDLKYTVDLTKLRSIIYDIKYEIDKEVKDATFTKNLDGDFIIEDEVTGIDLNVAKTIDTFREIIENNEVDNYDYKLELVATKEEAKVKREDIECFSTLLSKFETDYLRSNEDRTKKLDQAAKKLNGFLLDPDTEFSFNTVMGITPTKESVDEYMQNNDEVNVQLATTLYNAVLLAGLLVTDRTNVEVLPPYIEIGRDALVYGKGVDFKFKNTTTNPIYIEAFVNGGKLFVRLYGNENFKIYDSVMFKHNITNVVMPEDTVEKESEELAPLEKTTVYVGKSGCTCDIEVVYKVANEDDKVVKLPQSIYKPTSTIILVGKEIKDITQDAKFIEINKDKDEDKDNKINDEEMDRSFNHNESKSDGGAIYFG